MWLERLERTLRDGESARLREWLKTPLHREVVLEKCMLWHGPEILAVLGKLFPIDAIVPSRARPDAGWRRTLLAAALLIFGVGLATILLTGWPPWSDSEIRSSLRVDEIYRTPIGARREVRLPDGSTITMNTATSVVVKYEPRSRDVLLVSGEASFDVAKDPVRPFTLSAGQRDFETEGSRFNLRSVTPEKMEITVTEGQVTVLYPRFSPPITPAQLRNAFSFGESTLHPSEGAVVEPGGQLVGALEYNEVQARLAWQQGLIVFANEPLEDALAEISRYSTQEFVFADENLRDVRLSGEFRTGDVEGVLRVLHDDFLIDSRPSAGSRIVLSRH